MEEEYLRPGTGWCKGFLHALGNSKFGAGGEGLVSGIVCLCPNIVVLSSVISISIFHSKHRYINKISASYIHCDEGGLSDVHLNGRMRLYI
jgi:hypothetical protein